MNEEKFKTKLKSHFLKLLEPLDFHSILKGRVRLDLFENSETTDATWDALDYGGVTPSPTSD